MDYEWLLQDYLAGELVFDREKNSVGFENQGGDGQAQYQGYWQYDDGFILQVAEEGWYLYGEGGRMVQQGYVEYDGNSANLMDEDGYAYGELFLDEQGVMVESSANITKLDAFPYGNSEEN